MNYPINIKWSGIDAHWWEMRKFLLSSYIYLDAFFMSRIQFSSFITTSHNCLGINSHNPLILLDTFVIKVKTVKNSWVILVIQFPLVNPSTCLSTPTCWLVILLQHQSLESHRMWIKPVFHLIQKYWGWLNLLCHLALSYIFVYNLVFFPSSSRINRSLACLFYNLLDMSRPGKTILPASSFVSSLLL